MQLSLYHITDTKASGYDVYTDWVVAARSRKQALAINPNHECDDSCTPKDSKSWSPDTRADYLGKASVTFHQPTIICAAFNAG